VDTLCILQDSPVDKVAQIGMMDNIYRSAHFTIVAATGNDSSAGLPGILSRPRENTHQAFANVGGFRLVTVRSSEYEELETSKWISRAWTFQEKLCSRRTLIFAKSKVIFWCAKTVYREDVCMEGVDQEPHGLYSNLNPISEFARPGDQKQTGHQLFDTRLSFILMHHLQKQLTQGDDILNAFFGIAASMGSHFGSFHHGLPERYFQRALSWSYRNSFQRRNGFPSWSWAGWYHALHFTNSDIHSLRQDFRPTLTIYRFARLSSEGQVRKIQEDTLDCNDRTHTHFQPVVASIQARLQALTIYGADTSHLLSFFTSSCALSIRIDPCRDEEPPWWKGDREVMSKYAIERSRSREVIGFIVLDKTWACANVSPTSLHELIVICPAIGVDEMWDDSAFRLMLIEWKDGIAHRVQMSHSVEGDEWWKCEPKK
jgi:Heterokaryon incompatibility protein (HET)